MGGGEEESIEGKGGGLGNVLAGRAGGGALGERERERYVDKKNKTKRDKDRETERPDCGEGGGD